MFTMAKKVTLLAVNNITHGVKRLIVTKPKGYQFKPGQATDVAVNKPRWKKEFRPFTFTSLSEDKILEFTIKEYPLAEYPKHEGVTEQIHTLKPGDELLIDDPWGAINYKGPGVFIAGGAGITPFIAILRKLDKDNKLKGNTLIFSNKNKKDIIIEQELLKIFEITPKKLILTLTREKVSGYQYGRIDQKFLKKHVSNFKQNFYVCGPKTMVSEIREFLEKLGVKTDSVVFEK